MITRSGILLLVKLLGMAARIPLIRLLGAEGIGLYQMAYAFYGMGLTIVTGGIPTSLALTTAENDALGRRLFKRLSWLLSLAALGAGWFCYRFSEKLASSLGNEQLAFPIRCVAPAIVIVPLLTLWRGYLQGKNSHGSIAVSELVEQVLRLTVMLLLVYMWLPSGISAAIGGAMIGAFAGAIGAVVFLLAASRAFSSDLPAPFISKLPVEISANKEIALFLYSSLTITATRFIMPLSDFLDAYIVPNRLQAAGYSMSEALAIFGQLSGMGALVVYFPTLITSALAYTLSPKLVSDFAAKKKSQFAYRSTVALRFGWLWGCITGWSMYCYAEPMAAWIFHDRSAALAIRCLAIVPVFAGLRELSTVILWANGRKKRPLQGLILAIAVSVLCNYYLTAIPGFAYAGAVIGILSLEIATTAWNLFILKKNDRIAIPFIPTMTETVQGLACLIVIRFIYLKLDMLLSVPARWSDMIQMAVVAAAGLGYLGIKMRKSGWM